MYWWREIMGADVFLGFLGCYFLIGIAKGVVGQVVQRKEDYYKDDVVNDMKVYGQGGEDSRE
jgi:hypothetical protein